jgi:hypothetical protein
MRSSPALFVLFLALAVPLSADQTNFAAGSQAAPWLKLSNNARSAAMGDAGVAVADDVNASGENPAGLSQLGGQELSFMHHAYILDSSVEHLAYGLSAMPGLGLAASIDYMNFGSVDKYSIDASNNLTADGSFNPSGYHLDLGAGYAFGSLSAGLNAKMISEALDGSTSSSAFAADLGVLWKDASGLSLGATLEDLGSQLDGANLPSGLRAGGAYKMGLGAGSAVTVALDADVPSADSSASTVGGGIEYAAKDLYALRAGYEVVGNDGAGGLTLGAGLSYKILQLDYAYSAVGVLGNSNQLSALLKF